VDALADGRIDVAIVWGPLAGYYAKHSPASLRLAAVDSSNDGAQLPLASDICVGVRRGDVQLRHDVEQALVHGRGAIARVLDEFGVPQAAPTAIAASQPLADAN